jgi:fructuronate reductase
LNSPPISLSPSALPALQARGVRTPTYDRSRIAKGIVHFGPGAFHRVHQACYIDDALERDPRWGICEVALQSPGVRDALAPQDWLYTVAVLDERSEFRIVGSIAEALVAPESTQKVLERLVDPATRIVTATITEKGYCLGKDGGLDFSHNDIRHDLQNTAAPRTLIGFLARALRMRHDARREPFNVVSCDNLADNGKRLRRAVIEFVRYSDPSLAPWVEAEVPFPCTMVDSITPATDDALRERVTRVLGVSDRWPVQREFFSQWVVEDVLRGPTPDWAAIGVTLTNDVAAFERAKLRLLNGAHSTLAYVGRLSGIETVGDAMGDAALSAFVRRLMLDDIKPCLAAPTGLDLDRYIEAILRRFRNPAIRHLLAQIAWDGSQKLPFRLLATISEHLAKGRQVDRLCVPIAAWFHFIRRMTATNQRLVDPLAAKLQDLASRCSGNAAHDVALFLTIEAVFPTNLSSVETFRTAVESAYAQLAGVENSDSLAAALGKFR